MLTMIVAHANNNAIGSKNRLPWKCPADMAFFIKCSKQFEHLLMGTNTANGIGLLPQRKIHTLSSKKPFIKNGIHSFNSINSILTFNDTQKILICGGEMVYRCLLPHTSELLVTKLDLDVKNSDAFFPQYKNIFQHKTIIDEGVSNNIPFTISKYTR